MKKNLSADGMITIIKPTTTHRYSLFHKKVYTPDGNTYLIVSVREFRNYVEKRATTKEHWTYFFEGIGAN